MTRPAVGTRVRNPHGALFQVKGYSECEYGPLVHLRWAEDTDPEDYGNTTLLVEVFAKHFTVVDTTADAVLGEY